jgi:hypothetical protein
VASVRERTIPTERQQLVGEVSANFCRWRGVAWSVRRILYGRNLGFLDRCFMANTVKTKILSEQIFLSVFKRVFWGFEGDTTTEGHCHHYVSYSVVIIMVRSYAERFPVATIWMASLGTPPPLPAVHINWWLCSFKGKYSSMYIMSLYHPSTLLTAIGWEDNCVHYAKLHSDGYRQQRIKRKLSSTV